MNAAQLCVFLGIVAGSLGITLVGIAGGLARGGDRVGALVLVMSAAGLYLGAYFAAIVMVSGIQEEGGKDARPADE